MHSTRTDPQGDAIADALVVILQRELPEANALVARATNEKRLAALLESGQALLAVMRAADAEDLFLGRGAFAGLEGRHLRRLLAVGARLLVAVEAFPVHHAGMVREALVAHPGALAVRVPDAGESAVPLHPGAAER